MICNTWTVYAFQVANHAVKISQHIKFVGSTTQFKFMGTSEGVCVTIIIQNNASAEVLD